MKALKLFLTACILTVMSTVTYAQTHDHNAMSTVKTEIIKVSGNCDMCKARIEKAAKVDGVSKAEWNKETKMLAVTYDPAKTNTDAIGKKIAAAGHDNEKARADDKAYNALPGCCKYR